ncbi:pentalenene oxygenase [Nocardiopsis mwathae]|uniref:Pentalenene oxygenase n=1 Tax=Nocardiopsis mwathae TaxID=1472723 RepID=A0A7W9YEV7_9ACTN|nr:cytochrome P450 [Nocardiopsis mwathae]MBB6170802.1 pentalenene oxygenase [Nocardiopsis mwathae]
MPPTPTRSEFRLGTAPGGLPQIGHAMEFQKRPLEFITSLAPCGDLVEFRLGETPVYLVRHTELIQDMLRDTRTFDKGGPIFEKSRAFFGNGLASSEDAIHRRQRPLVQPSMHVRRIAEYVEVMREEAVKVTESWTEGRSIGITAAMQALTTGVTARTMFSTGGGPDAVAEVHHCLPIILRGVYLRMTAPEEMVEQLPAAERAEFDDALARLHGLVDKIIEDYRRSGVDHGDALSMMLSARNEDGEGLTDQEIHDNVLNLFSGGVETTASSLAWTFHLLAEHPEIERRMHDELDGVLDGRAPANDDLNRLPFTRRVFTEALRLYPPVWLVSRTAPTDAELGGHPVPAGSTLMYSPYVVHRDPEVFADPDTFDPDRWLPERMRTHPRGAMIPFGAGRRKCLADNFAMTEGVLALAIIGSRWRLRHAPGTTVTTHVAATLGPGPLPMTPEARRTGAGLAAPR